jgi:hypothetical protein
MSDTSFFSGFMASANKGQVNYEHSFGLYHLLTL